MEKLEVRVRECLAKGWLEVNILFEILGSPKEHIIEVLNLLIKKIGEEKGVIVVKNKVHEAHLAKHAETFFSSFAEVEIVVEDLKKLIEIVFDYMPSSVEIVSPPDLKFELSGANGLLNDLATRLHQYDTLVRAIRAERDLFKEKLDKAGIKIDDEEREKVKSI